MVQELLWAFSVQPPPAPAAFQELPLRQGRAAQADSTPDLSRDAQDLLQHRVNLRLIAQLGKAATEICAVPQHQAVRMVSAPHAPVLRHVLEFQQHGNASVMARERRDVCRLRLQPRLCHALLDKLAQTDCAIQLRSLWSHVSVLTQ